MTTLEKIQISGIRSYDPNIPVIIKFSKPLTVIVGVNGSGKTTIIEALKFVCTGQNPPDSSKGKSFVHDPSISDNSIVKAQIKLTLVTHQKRKITIIRSFQVSQTTKIRKYQQIDATIRFINDEGDKITATHKCAEIDNIAAQMMNVSKAILSNVIFCHQEDSFWPLSDSKTLKLKFDDIFASTRYSKAIDKLKSLKKQLRIKVSLLEKDFLLAKNNLQLFRKYNNEYDSLVKEIVLLSDTVENLKKDIKESDEKLSSLEIKSRELKDKENTLDKLRFELKTAQLERESILKKIVNPIDTTSETEILELEKNSKEKNNFLKHNLEMSERKIQNIEKTLNALKEEHENNIKNIGKLQSDEERNEKILEKLMRSTEEIAVKMDFVIDEGTAVQQGTSLLEMYTRDFKRREDLLDQIKKEFDINESMRNKDIQSLENALTTNAHILKQTDKDISENEIKLLNIKNELTRNAEKETVFEKSKDKIKEIDQKIKNNQANNLVSAITTKSLDIEKLLSEHKDMLDKTEHKLDILRTNSSLDEQIRLRSEEYESAKAEFEVGIEKSRKLFEEYKGKEFPKRTNEEDFPLHYKRTVDEMYMEHENIKNLETKRFREDKLCYSACSGKLQISNSDIEKLKSKLNISESSIPTEYKDELDTLIEKNQKSLEDLQSKILFERGATFVYRKIIDKISENKKCPICERTLYKKDIEQVILSLEGKISMFENNLKTQNFEKNTKELTEKITKLRNYVPVKKSIDSFNKNLEEKTKELTAFQKELKSYEVRLEENKKLEQKLKKEEEDLNKILSDAKHLCEKYNNLRKLKSDLEQKKYTRKNMFGGENEYEQTLNERNKLKEKIDELEKQLKDIRHQKDALLEEEKRLITELSSLRKEESMIKGLKLEKDRLTIEENECKKKLETLRILFEKTSKEIESQNNQKNLLIDKHQQKKDEFDKKKHELVTEIKAMDKEKSSFKDLLEDAIRYESLESDRKEILSLFEKNKANIQTLENQKNAEEENLKNAVKEIRELSSILENINYTLEFKSKEAVCNALIKKVEAIEKELKENFKKENVEENILSEKTKNEDFKKMNSEAEGRKSAFKDQAIELSKTIKSNNALDNAEEKFKEVFFELESNTLAMKDLEVYQKALDNALIDFHSIKMKEINQILKKYWKLIYRGRDIDHIEIVSSADSDMIQNSSQARRNYSYFVMMVCGSVKLEMKGRCSSGQKVLASLLIRLALAESFCSNCNILTLDEPTTNLDDDNVASLGEALKTLIEEKRKSADFQLILITHNVKFAQLLGEIELVDDYLRVFKNENNFSRVKRVLAGE